MGRKDNPVKDSSDMWQADSTAHHFRDAHFPGLYSIVIGRTAPGLLRRMFIAEPDQLHVDLQDENSSFLWHAHGYDFRETTVAGAVVNLNARLDPRGGEVFHSYRIEAGIDSGKRPSLTRLGTVGISITDKNVYGEGESYELRHDIIHRVTFHPNAKNGWFACLVEETRAAIAPAVVYSRHRLNDVPNADKLYKRIDTDEANRVLGLLSQRGR